MYSSNIYSGGSNYSCGSSNYSSSTGYASNNIGYSSNNTGYSSNTGYSAGYNINHTPEQPIMSENFLNEDRPTTPIITEMKEIREIIQKTYKTITEQEMPEEIQIRILDETEFKQLDIYHPGLAGFSLNRYGKGVSEIVVKQDHMDSLLLTIGHEIGHVLSPTLSNKHDEEAKAHAFSLTWMETIRDNNIGGLQPNISPNPAQNGLHDVAFDFVKYLLQTGAKSFDIFKTLAYGLTSIIVR